MEIIKKVVPIIIKNINNQLNILVFRHPTAGIQIVKGTVEKNESLEQATLRELMEESGIQNATIYSYLGVYSPVPSPPQWHIFLCHVQQDLPKTWTHFCQDDGGLNFHFFWHQFEKNPTEDWHPLFSELLYFLQQTLININEDYILDHQTISNPPHNHSNHDI